ncbi:MAG: pyridoxal-phosphate dependent enzyme [Sulfitobacter sp.]
MTDAEIGKITLKAMQKRHAELKKSVHCTPVVDLQAPAVTEVLGGGSMTLKLECFQQTGTFKARGALSNIQAIPNQKRAHGITAASAGNHAIAAAWAAKAAGLSAKVVMQNNANPIRIERACAQGSEVILRDPGMATFNEAKRLAQDEGRTFIHPFDGVDTVLGTAGVGLELMTQIRDLDAVVVSVGGGGLISGVAAAVKLLNPACKVYGVEPEGAAAMSRSLSIGAPVTIESVDTIADSLGPPMAMALGHAMCATYVDQIVTVSDDAICAGMVVLQQDAKLAVEPAAGAAMAGALGPLRKDLQGKRIGIVVCGANIDAVTYAQQINRGAAHLQELLQTP